MTVETCKGEACALRSRYPLATEFERRATLAVGKSEKRLARSDLRASNARKAMGEAKRRA
jgi:hypothetical protein